MGGIKEGDVEGGGYPYVRGEEPDRVKVTFPTIGVPPENVSISCSPTAVELINPAN